MKLNPIVIRKRRLRKKLHVDEFKQMGFNLLIEFVDSYKGNTDAFCNDFIDEIGYKIPFTCS